MEGTSKSAYQQPFFIDGMDDHSVPGPEVEEGSGRPRPWFFESPCSNVKTYSISRKTILVDLLKALGGSTPEYNTKKTNSGFQSHVISQVPDVRGVSRPQNMYGYINSSLPTKSRAEERAADNLIRCLKRKFNFEVNDFNWLEKQQYNLDRYDLWAESRTLKEEIRKLEERNDSLVNGWSTTLRLLKPVRQMASITRASAVAAFNVLDSTGETEEVLNNVASVEEYIGKTIQQGSKWLDRAAGTGA